MSANRGLIEYADLLKRPLEAFKYLLGFSETQEVPLEHMVLQLDEVLIASSNEKHLAAFKELPDFPSFKGRIELVRLNRNGTSTTEFFDYQPGKDISQGFNPPLRDRDTVIVRRSYYGKTVDLVNELVAPLTSIVNTFYLYNRNNR